MTNKEQYQNAMAKISPSADFAAIMQEKLAVERLAMQASADTDAPQAPKPATKGKAPIHWKRIAPFAAVAAAVMLVAVPVLRQSYTQNNATEFALFSGGDPLLTAQAPQSAPAYAQSDDDAVAGSFAEPEAAYDKAATAKSNDSAALVSFSVPKVLSLPGQQPMRASNVTQLASANPTYNLASSQLPETLPVYEMPAGAEGRTLAASYLERAADGMGYGLYLEDGLLSGESALASGFLMNSARWNPEQSILTQTKAKEWYATAEGYTLTLYPIAQNEPAEQTSLQQIKALDAQALTNFGALLNLSYPAYQTPIASMSYSGAVQYLSGSHFYYERGNAEDDIATQLQHYSFQRLYVSYDANGNLASLQYHLMPLGNAVQYPLRSLTNALKDGVDAINQALDGQNLLVDFVTAADVVAWQIDYALDETSQICYPVYTFTAAVTPTASANVNGYGVYIQYSVPALASVYRNEGEASLSGLTDSLRAFAQQ